MKVTVEELSSVKKIVHVEIPEDTVAGELNTAYKEILKTAKIKGFRPGKAPRSVLERMYKKDVHADVRTKLIQESVFAALEEKGLNIVAPPQIDPPALEDKKTYAYQAVVEIYPEIGEIDFKGLSLKKTLYPVTDKEIDLQLKMVQRSLTEQAPVEEDRLVAENDFLGAKGFVIACISGKIRNRINESPTAPRMTQRRCRTDFAGLSVLFFFIEN